MSESWDRDEFRLGATANDRRFWERIVPQQLAGKPSREQPLAIVLVGQPGSGKSRTTAALGDILGLDSFIRADSDLFKPYHPAYGQLLGTDDQLLTSATRHDGRVWMAKAQQYARDRRVDVLIDHTIDDLDYFRDTIWPYHDVGYRVAALFLAVPEGLSRQGVLDRYLRQRQESGGGRLTIASKAAASYRGILNGADTVDGEQLAHVTAVFRRGLGEASYYNKSTLGSGGRST